MSDEEYFENLVSSSIDGALTEAEKEKLARHLEQCPSCAALKRDLERMCILFHEGDETAQIPAGLHAGIMKRVREDGHMKVVRPEKPVRRLPVFTMVAVAAVVVLAVLGGGIGQMFTMVTNGSPGSGASMASNEAGSADTSAESAGASGGGMDAVPGAGGDAGISGKASGDAEVEEPMAGAQDTGGDLESAASAAPASDDGSVAAQSEDTEEALTSGSVASDMYADAPKEEKSAKENQFGREAVLGLEIPENLKGTVAAHCYLAVGSGEEPEINGELLLTENGVSYFRLENDMSCIEETFASLEQAGYTVEAYEDVGIVIDNKAETWILILQKT